MVYFKIIRKIQMPLLTFNDSRDLTRFSSLPQMSGLFTSYLKQLAPSEVQTYNHRFRINVQAVYKKIYRTQPLKIIAYPHIQSSTMMRTARREVVDEDLSQGRICRKMGIEWRPLLNPANSPRPAKNYSFATLPRK